LPDQGRATSVHAGDLAHLMRCKPVSGDSAVVRGPAGRTEVPDTSAVMVAGTVEAIGRGRADFRSATRVRVILSGVRLWHLCEYARPPKRRPDAQAPPRSLSRPPGTWPAPGLGAALQGLRGPGAQLQGGGQHVLNSLGRRWGGLGRRTDSSKAFGPRNRFTAAWRAPTREPGALHRR